MELGIRAAEHLDQRIVDDLDDHLPRGDRANNLGADRARGDLVDEIARHGERDVGLEQCNANLAHRRAHFILGQSAAAAELVEDAGQAIAKAVEHPNSLMHQAQKRTNRRRAKLADQRASVDAPNNVCR